MGTGKTAVGKAIARQLKRRFVDIDNLIEKRENKKITQIFADRGEPYFRKVESETLRAISSDKDLVVACGGGIVLDIENIRIIRESGVMICLSARPGVIIARTQRHNHRPLLNVESPKEKVRELLESRACFYAQSDYTVDTSDLSIADIIKKIDEYIKSKGA